MKMSPLRLKVPEVYYYLYTKYSFHLLHSSPKWTLSQYAKNVIKKSVFSCKKGGITSHTHKKRAKGYIIK